MKLAFDFTVDRNNKKIAVNREFAATANKVWTAWTNPEWLNQWWAPKPWKAHTVSFDFREGGMWHYFMQGPEGDKHYCRFDYKTIDSGKSYSGLDAFCDENAVPNESMPRLFWHNSFEDRGETTMVHIVITFAELEDLEKIIQMGFKEGFAMGMDNLDALFAEK